MTTRRQRSFLSVCTAAARLLALVTAMVVMGVPAEAAQERTDSSFGAEPMRCWWRMSASAVRVGERFTALLTCSVLENDKVSVVPNEAPLDPAAFQLRPFEVVRGTRAPDLRTAGRRFFQYEYELRVIDDAVIGQAVLVSPGRIGYRLRIRANATGSVDGTEQFYELPAEPVQVLSLVPAEASAIRPAPPETFAEVQARETRATTRMTIGAVLLALAGLSGLVAVERFVRRVHVKKGASGALVSDAVILRNVARELAGVQQARGEQGWTPELVARALTLLRLAAALIRGRPVSQRLAPAGARVESGTLLLTTSRWAKGGRQRVAVSAASSREREGSGVMSSPAPRGVVDATTIENVIAAFTRARYGRDGLADAVGLDAHMMAGCESVRGLTSRQAVTKRKWSAAVDRMRKAGQWVWTH